MFGPQIRLKSLTIACRSLSTLLHAGVAIQKAFDVAATKTGDKRCRLALDQVATAVRRGEEVSSAMRAQGGAFPDLMLEMVHVAELSGALPEILSALAEHYENHLRLRRGFVTALMWPVFQFIAAVLVIALLIFILGWIGETRGGGQVTDVLGFGLSGTSGALIWLSLVFGSVFSLFVLYQIVVKGFRGKRFLDAFFLGIPVVGNCLRSFAIARFSWAFHLTQQTGMPIDQSLRASLRATNNGAFQEAAGMISRKVHEGSTLSEALASCRLFPLDFLSMVEVAETTGTVPEALHRLSPQFEAEARRSLSAMATALGWLIWGVVAAFIIFLIFRIALWYVGLINDAVKAAG